MDNQHRQISGYRELNQEEIDLINEVKARGAQLDALVNRVIRKNQELHEAGDRTPFDAEAHRWANIARTHLQQGISTLTRAVAKPEGF